MFFKKKEKAQKELLSIENIRTGCPSMPQDDVINAIGQMLVDTDYVESDYIKGMHERELSFSTNMGGGLAIPHGVEWAKEKVKSSGLAVMTFPDGITWGDGDPVHIVIAIAALGDGHLELLAKVSEVMFDPDSAKKIIAADAKTICQMLGG